MEQAVSRRKGGKANLDVTFWILLAAGLALFLLVTVTPGARHSWALRGDLARATAVKGRLDATVNMLEARERALAGDPFYNEAVLREKMKYTRPGEKEVQMPRKASLVTVPGTKDFVPPKREEPCIAANVTSWTLLAAAGVLVLAAFIFFDRPGGSR